MDEKSLTLSQKGTRRQESIPDPRLLETKNGFQRGRKISLDSKAHTHLAD